MFRHNSVHMCTWHKDILGRSLMIDFIHCGEKRSDAVNRPPPGGEPQGGWCLSWWQYPHPLVDTDSEAYRHAELGVQSGLFGLWNSWGSRRVPKGHSVCICGGRWSKDKGVGGVWWGHGELLPDRFEKVLDHHLASEKGEVHCQHCEQWGWCAADLDQGCCGSVEGLLWRPPQSDQRTCRRESQAPGPRDGLPYLRGWSCQGCQKTSRWQGPGGGRVSYDSAASHGHWAWCRWIG